MLDKYEIITARMHSHSVCADHWDGWCEICGHEVTDDPRWAKIADRADACVKCLVKRAYDAGRRAAFEDLVTGSGHAHLELAEAGVRVTAERRIPEYEEFMVASGI